ncbi:ATPase family AAA domain-containing protein FIGL1-like [Cornus florida]|uniref:ATPase family AAA domain-containing protein FIGL1-like n=1 Tax=Cornus florida TaxID=4283 RepID=UPI002897D388|nr:ATPase family AAA domain-containing protein FIGL1-like [Cornus florida]
MINLDRPLVIPQSDRFPPRHLYHSVELMADERGGGGGNLSGQEDRHGVALSRAEFDDFQRQTKQALQDIQAKVMLDQNQNRNNKRSRNMEELQLMKKEKEDKRAKNLKELNELLRSSECQAEQAGKDTGCVFGKREIIHVDNIKQDFQVLQSKNRTLGYQQHRQYNLGCKMQERLTSFFGNILKANNDLCKNSKRNSVFAQKSPSYQVIDATHKRGLGGSPSASVSPQSDNNASNKNYGVGVQHSGIHGNFVPPIKLNVGNMFSGLGGKGYDGIGGSRNKCLEMLSGPDGELPEKLRGLDTRLIEQVSNEIMNRDPNVRWDDIAGLEHAKKCVTEMVIWPLLRPDIFEGCRSPGRGLLLFGPPGTGKTMVGKAIAGEAKATFFYISASSLTSKWVGEGEKLVRALFGVASCRQPAVIFVDEIDSLLSQRKSEGEHEASRRLKTQFLIEMEGFDSGSEQILLIGATNRPQELDEAARRRLTKRLYIPLPSSDARAWIIRNLLSKDKLFKLSKEDCDTISKFTEGYSGSDMKNLVKDASMGPLREALKQGIEIAMLKKEDMRPVTLQDFEDALQEVRPSVSLNELSTYEEWNKQFGSLSL